MAAAAARLVIFGTNHRSSPVALRDLLHVSEAALPAALAELAALGLGEVAILSTCDRFEVLAAAEPAAEPALRRWVAGRAPEVALDGHLYLHRDEAAIRHLFSVASSLDSLVIGEPQVLGQVKASHRVSQAAGMIGRELEAVLQAAYGAAKRVRSETRVAERPVSLAAAAAQIARDVHGELDTASGLLIGIGDMGVLLAEHLKAAGVARLVVAAQSAARAEPVARQLGCNHAAMDQLEELLAASDVVVSAQGAGQYTLTAALMTRVLRRRRQRPIFLIDAAIPGDLAPDIDAVDGAFRYDLDALEAVAMAGRAKREAASKDAWRIVDDEVQAFQRARSERAAVPALAALRRHFELERERVLTAQPGVDAAEATRLLVNRLLHDPSEALRALAASGDDVEREQAESLIRRLFDLEENS